MTRNINLLLSKSSLTMSKSYVNIHVLSDVQSSLKLSDYLTLDKLKNTYLFIPNINPCTVFLNNYAKYYNKVFTIGTGLQDNVIYLNDKQRFHKVPEFDIISSVKEVQPLAYGFTSSEVVIYLTSTDVHETSDYNELIDFSNICVHSGTKRVNKSIGTTHFLCNPYNKFDFEILSKKIYFDSPLSHEYMTNKFK
jgi:hypothetical protein